MALNAYLTCKGAIQGDIRGSVKQKGREGWIAVYEVHHEIKSPRDPASGQATGKRQHRPLVIVKEIDKSTPLLLKALITSETLTEFTLRFYAPSTAGVGGTGVEVHYYTIKLTEAVITNNNLDMLLNKIEPGIKLPVLERIEFVYKKIEWTIVEGNKTTSDDWAAAGA